MVDSLYAILILKTFFWFQIDYEDTYSIVAFGGGGAVALWLAAAVVGAIDSIPVVSTLHQFQNLHFCFL